MADFEAKLAPPPNFPTGGVVQITGAWGEVIEFADGIATIKTQATMRHFLAQGWTAIAVTHATERGGNVG